VRESRWRTSVTSCPRAHQVLVSAARTDAARSRDRRVSGVTAAADRRQLGRSATFHHQAHPRRGDARGHPPIERPATSLVPANGRRHAEGQRDIEISQCAKVGDKGRGERRAACRPSSRGYSERKGRLSRPSAERGQVPERQADGRRLPINRAMRNGRAGRGRELPRGKMYPWTSVRGRWAANAQFLMTVDGGN